MSITTRMIDGELWLHDGSRKLTAEEVAMMQQAVQAAQSAHAWDSAASQATDLGPLVSPVWDAATQSFKCWRRDGSGPVPDELMQYHRARILGQSNGLFSVGPAT